MMVPLESTVRKYRINDLPTMVIAKIFRELPPTDRAVIATISREFRVVVRDTLSAERQKLRRAATGSEGGVYTAPPKNIFLHHFSYLEMNPVFWNIVIQYLSDEEIIIHDLCKSRCTLAYDLYLDFNIGFIADMVNVQFSNCGRFFATYSHRELLLYRLVANTQPDRIATEPRPSQAYLVYQISGGSLSRQLLYCTNICIQFGTDELYVVFLLRKSEVHTSVESLYHITVSLHTRVYSEYGSNSLKSFIYNWNFNGPLAEYKSNFRSRLLNNGDVIIFSGDNSATRPAMLSSSIPYPLSQHICRNRIQHENEFPAEISCGDEFFLSTSRSKRGISYQILSAYPSRQKCFDFFNGKSPHSYLGIQQSNDENLVIIFFGKEGPNPLSFTVQSWAFFSVKAETVLTVNMSEIYVQKFCRKEGTCFECCISISKDGQYLAVQRMKNANDVSGRVFVDIYQIASGLLITSKLIPPCNSVFNLVFYGEGNDLSLLVRIDLRKSHEPENISSTHKILHFKLFPGLSED